MRPGRTDKRGLTCRQVRSLLTAYIEDGLAPEMRQAVEEHLAGCAACSRALREAEAMAGELRLEAAGDRRELSPEASARIQESVYKRMRRGLVVRRTGRLAGQALAAAAVVALVVAAIFLGDYLNREREKAEQARETVIAAQRQTAQASSVPSATPPGLDMAQDTAALYGTPPVSSTVGARLGKIVFLRGGDVWESDLGTGREKRLTEGGGCSQPRWSPSGRWVAFLNERTLRIVAAEGGPSRPVSEAEVVRAAWSPIEDRLAYVTASGRLWVAAADGSDPQELVAGPGAENAGVGNTAWSPDGQWLAFEWTEGEAGGPPSYQGLRRIRADGSGLSEIYSAYHLPEKADTVALASWSPGGSGLAFWQIPDDSSSLAADGVPLLTVPAQGGQPTQIFGAVLPYADFVAWSPDAQRIAVVAGAGRESWYDKTLMVTEDANEGLVLLSPSGVGLSPAWSPDGRYLAYVTAPAVAGVAGGDAAVAALGARRIWIAGSDGQGQHQLTGGSQFREEWPRWSVDGNYVLYVRAGGQAQNPEVDLRLVWALTGQEVGGIEGLGPVADSMGYYGHVDWGQLFDWWTPTLQPVPTPAVSPTPYSTPTPTGSASPVPSLPAAPSRLTEEYTQVMLDDYSRALSSGRTAHLDLYSHAMQDLFNERRAFYQEFFDLALHSRLLGIESRYQIQSVTADPAQEGLYHVQATEWLTTTGRYRPPTAEEYTPARACLWALARTDQPAVRQALQNCINVQMAKAATLGGTGSPYDTVFILRHHLVIQATGGGYAIEQDAYDDKDRNNTTGTDVVEWVDGQFVRSKPDWNAWPDYVMWHEPLAKVEELGASLLRSDLRLYGGTPVPDPHPGWLTYTQSAYGFSFRYPPDWEVVTKWDVTNVIWLRSKARPDLELSIGFRQPDETAIIQRTGVGGGELETQGTAYFLGRDLSRDVLLWKGNVKGVLYDKALEIDVDGLIFTLSLDDRSPDYDTSGIPPAEQAVADQVVGTFLLAFDAAQP